VSDKITPLPAAVSEHDASAVLRDFVHRVQFKQAAQDSSSTTDPELSAPDKALIDKIVRDVRRFDEHRDDAGIDSLQKDVTCVSRERLERLIPVINKDLDPSGLYFGKYPGSNEVTITKGSTAEDEDLLGGFTLPKNADCSSLTS
jgi:hypothetical protein